MCGGLSKIVLRYNMKKRLLVVILILLIMALGLRRLNSAVSTTLQKNKFAVKNTFHEMNPEYLKTDEIVEETDSCETVEIAVVCAGYNASREVVTLIKSILFYRRYPLHIHFVVNPVAKKILSTLFRTWSIPDFIVSFYLSNTLEPKVSWIDNFHYSGVYGLLKLVISDVLPQHIKKVIVLDIDIVFLTDIGKLWKLLANFNSKQAIGLVENQSDWYLGNITSHEPWPAVGRGFNTGVMLVDREKLKRSQWDNMWVTVTKNVLENLNGTLLADQDIINAVIKENRNMVFTLPCLWNIQLSMNTLSMSCYKNDPTSIKALHWNAPSRQKTKNGLASLFQQFYSFVIYDGGLLRRPVDRCHTGEEMEQEAPDFGEDFCQGMMYEALKLRRTHLFYFPYDYVSGNPDDVTLVVHLSSDRISMLDLIADHWEGPISVAIYLSDSYSIKLDKHVHDSLALKHRTNIGYHLVYENFDDTMYPINLLRNIALQQVATVYMFLCDIDFLPSHNLYEYLTNSQLPLYPKGSKVAYVIPAFEIQSYKPNPPKTKSELIILWDKGDIVPFRANIWPVGHNATNYSLWHNSSETYSVQWVKDYEPYVVLPKRSCPSYSKKFFGFGWNKVSHIMELNAAGFEFQVVPYGFVVHIPHTASLDITKFRSSSDYRRCVNSLKMEFVKELASKYNIDPEKYSK